MELATIFYQGEGLGNVELVEVDPSSTLAALLDALRTKHGWSAEVELFAEDRDETLRLEIAIHEIVLPGGTKIHAHRCHRIQVGVSFNGTTLPFAFAPSATIARVTRHAAVHGFNLSEDAAAEHVLQIKGSVTQPGAGTHVGSLVAHPACGIAFDLVPKQRVQGALTPVG